MYSMYFEATESLSWEFEPCSPSINEFIFLSEMFRPAETGSIREFEYRISFFWVLSEFVNRSSSFIECRLFWRFRDVDGLGGWGSSMFRMEWARDGMKLS
jgi:hypothetical protein